VLIDPKAMSKAETADNNSLLLIIKIPYAERWFIQNLWQAQLRQLVKGISPISTFPDAFRTNVVEEISKVEGTRKLCCYLTT
jgi:hypothetical protein